jgi:hypothetical protein
LHACFDGAVQQNNGFTAAGPGWLHEIKHDGFRIRAHRDAASDCLAVHHARSRRQSCNGSNLQKPDGGTQRLETRVTATPISPICGCTVLTANGKAMKTSATKMPSA